MNKTLGLTVLAVIMTSACVGQGGGVIQNILTIDVVKGGVEDMTIQAKVPEFARANGDFNWQLVSEPVIMVKEFGIEVIDRCQFVNKTPDSFALPEIRANNTQIFTMTYHTPQVEFERPCPVSFKANYMSNATMSTTVAVLQELEYAQRKAAGKLDEIPIRTFTSRNPLQLTISWGPYGQPLLDSSANQLYIDYSNAGTGTIAMLEPGQVTIQVPANMGNDINCDDYSWDATKRTLTLSKQLDFLRKEAKRSTCTFTAKASKSIDSQSLAITATYRYQLEGTVSIPLVAR
jgi:hypothetical protein